MLLHHCRLGENIGGACGRIVPEGSGILCGLYAQNLLTFFSKWYQDFEYGIAHWLQKATESVLFSVLTPCF